MADTLYGSRALADWIRAGGRPQRRSFAHATRLRWQAFWFEQNWRTELARLQALPLPEDPVFIIGPWRSGTTVLHELLTASTGWPTPATWQCFNPSTCFLAPAPPRESFVPRPMDEGLISTRGPQEDEFAALLLGEESVYRGFIDPRRLPECGARLWEGEHELPRWQAFIRGIAAQAPGRLLLKSPNHTFRLALLRRCFPRAQFVWIGRRSGEVMASNLKMWRAMMQRYALWDCPPGVLERFLSDALGACARTLSRCLEDMSPAQLLWVDFEALRNAPRQVVLAVLRFMHAGSAEDSADLEARVEQALQRTPVHAGSRKLAPADSAISRLDELTEEASRRFGIPAVARPALNR
jgi:omega-hydroxy-beta-dihydromenaquinone-9 sulfotransferase